MIGSAFAQGIVVPGDSNGDKIVSAEEVAAAEKLAQEGKLSADELQEIKHIHEKYPINITDSANRTVTIYKPVKTIISLNREITETLRAINASDKIIGVDDNTIRRNDFYPEFKNYPNLGTSGKADVEKILELRPDVVFITAWPSGDESANNIEKLGIPVVRVYCFLPSNYLDEVKLLGHILETEESTEDFIDFYQGYLNKIEEKVAEIPDKEKVKVYMEWNKPYFVGGTASGYHQCIMIAGGNDIFSDISAFTSEVDPEEVIKRDPDVIVRSISIIEGEGYKTDDMTALKNERDAILNSHELANVTAVKDKRVYIISTNLLFGTRYLIGIAYMAKWFYPDLFEDLDPEKIHQECITRFHGLDYNVSEHGVFIYPPMN